MVRVAREWYEFAPAIGVQISTEGQGVDAKKDVVLDLSEVEEAGHKEGPRTIQKAERVKKASVKAPIVRALPPRVLARRHIEAEGLIDEHHFDR